MILVHPQGITEVGQQRHKPNLLTFVLPSFVQNITQANVLTANKSRTKRKQTPEANPENQ